MLKNVLGGFFCFFFLLQASADINIDQVRSTCDKLTNESITEIEGHQIRRKTQLLVHVQGLCENLERLFDEKQLNSVAAEKYFSTLNLIMSSWLNKFEIEQGVGLIDILIMGVYHDISPWLLKYEVPKTTAPLVEVADSIYWKKPTGPLEKIFDEQALEQKIDPNISLVMLDELEAKGSTPKAHVTDIRNGSTWLMKWGDEVHADPVASRIFAALGYNVDHPYYFDSGKVTLILGKMQNKKPRTPQNFVRFIFNAYQVNLSPFISKAGKINRTMIKLHPDLADFKNEYYMQFQGLALEPRPAAEVRLGGMMTNLPEISSRRELRGALLAHLWLGSWDTKESNTLLSIWLNNEGKTHLQGSYSDLGVSMGVNISKFPRDLKPGLVNSFSWDLAKRDGNKISFDHHMNFFSKAYRQASYEDLKWMAGRIALVNEAVLRSSLSFSGWPLYLQELYFNKLAERRRQILEVFEIPDPNPMKIDRKYSYQDLIKDGELVREPSLEHCPEGLLHQKGRFRGFGW